MKKKYLVLVESPAKAKTIGKILGKNYKVLASMGHVRDLPKMNLGVKINTTFKPKYVIIPEKRKIVSDIKKSAQNASKIFLATDPDREGEAISWHLSHILDIDPSEKCRVVFHEITKSAVSKAFETPSPIDLNKVDAQQARRILDRLVGYKLSPILWEKIKKGLSAGRVQSVALRLICEREDEIRKFVPKEYWTIDGLFKRNDGFEFISKLTKYKGKKITIKNEKETNKILSELNLNKDYLIDKVEKTTRKKSPPPPFITSTLQREAFNQLKFSVKKTMRIAQELYEGVDIGGERVGIITYMRTDSFNLSEESIKEAKEYIREKFGKEFVVKTKRRYKKKEGAQEAHEAIRPTSAYRTPEDIKQYLSSDQYRLYKLIWSRFLATQFKDAEIAKTKVWIKKGDYLFLTEGEVLTFPGYTLIYNDISGKDVILPDFSEGEEVELLKLSPAQHFTKPPARYNEATLVKALEEKGIGRPSTYAQIVSTILARRYVEKIDGKYLAPTNLGEIVNSLLVANFPQIINVDFTAKMEEDLDKIEEGKLDWQKALRDFYDSFLPVLEEARKKIEKIELKKEEEFSGEFCEICGRPMVIKHGKYGDFLACSGYPECKNTKPLIKTIGVPCPKDGCNGEIVERISKKGRKYYTCTNYPECDFISFSKPVDKFCPKCGSILVEAGGKRKKYLKCSNPECDYKEELKEEESLEKKEIVA